MLKKSQITKKSFILIFAFLLVINIFAGCSNLKEKNNNNAIGESHRLTQEKNVPIETKKQPQQNNLYTKPIEKVEKPKPKKQQIEKQKQQKHQKIVLNVPLIAQNPELKFGCEVTSLAMVLRYAGVKVTKNQLANQVKKDTDPLKVDKKGNIVRWGDPNEGFVGDMTGRNKGYAVHVKPLQALMERYLPNRTVNLTGQSFDEILAQVRKERPVVLWTTGDYRKPDRFESWYHKGKKMNVALDLHAVVLVGVDANNQYIYLNDPLSEKKAVRVRKDYFVQSWIALGKQALSYN